MLIEEFEFLGEKKGKGKGKGKGRPPKAVPAPKKSIRVPKLSSGDPNQRGGVLFLHHQDTARPCHGSGQPSK